MAAALSTPSYEGRIKLDADGFDALLVEEIEKLAPPTAQLHNVLQTLEELQIHALSFGDERRTSSKQILELRQSACGRGCVLGVDTKAHRLVVLALRTEAILGHVRARREYAFDPSDGRCDLLLRYGQ